MREIGGETSLGAGLGTALLPPAEPENKEVENGGAEERLGEQEPWRPGW